jgi:hypothetical protein
MSSKKGGGGAGHSGKNKVNEFDEEACVTRQLRSQRPPCCLHLARYRACIRNRAQGGHTLWSIQQPRCMLLQRVCNRRWSNVFNTMTKEKEGEESAESISSREAMQMVTKILDKMVWRSPPHSI